MFRFFCYRIFHFGEIKIWITKIKLLFYYCILFVFIFIYHAIILYSDKQVFKFRN